MMNTHYGHRSKGWVAEHVHVWVHNTTLTTCCVAKMKAAAALLGISAVSSRVSGFVAFPTSARSVGNGDQCSSQKTTGSRHALSAADEAQPPQAERPPERQFISILTVGKTSWVYVCFVYLVSPPWLAAVVTNLDCGTDTATSVWFLS